MQRKVGSAHFAQIRLHNIYAKFRFRRLQSQFVYANMHTSFFFTYWPCKVHSRTPNHPERKKEKRPKLIMLRAWSNGPPPAETNEQPKTSLQLIVPTLCFLGQKCAAVQQDPSTDTRLPDVRFCSNFNIFSETEPGGRHGTKSEETKDSKKLY